MAIKLEEPKVPVSQLFATASYLQELHRENQWLRDENSRLQKGLIPSRECLTLSVVFYIVVLVYALGHGFYFLISACFS